MILYFLFFVCQFLRHGSYGANTNHEHLILLLHLIRIESRPEYDASRQGGRKEGKKKEKKIQSKVVVMAFPLRPSTRRERQANSVNPSHSGLYSESVPQNERIMNEWMDG